MLPALREELALLPGPVLPDGQPSWTLHDPTRNLFFRIDWPTFEILRRWQMGQAATIAEAIAGDTTLMLDDRAVIGVAEFLVANQLTRPDGTSSARKLAERRAAMKGTMWQWVLHHYLFFRVPLVRPDRALNTLLPWSRFVFSRGFALLTMLALVFGFLQVVRQSEVFIAQFVDVLSLDGLTAYAIALVFVKTLHEMGHALVAKRFGCRVPTMGVAFMVLWPMAYTDTNDAWRLTNPRQRLMVSAAGISTELILAIWATVLWSLLPDGPARSAAFVVATTSWVSTLVINASPFMRFDGYFILSDLLDMPNLHDRCFALARWRLREVLFGLGEAPPERPSARRQRWMILFAWCTWIYRLILFIGIALLVYHLFFKALGIFLFVVEIAWFILRPLRSELQAWTQRRGRILQSGRSGVSLLIALALVGTLFVPWPGRVTTSGILKPAESWPVHATAGARIEALPFRDGDRVPANAVVMRLQRPDLLSRRDLLVARIEQLSWQSAAAGFDRQTRERMLVTTELLATAQAELASVEAEIGNFLPRAPFDGNLHDVDPDLKVGQWVSPRERLGLLVKENSRQVVETWLEEHDVARIGVGSTAVFVQDGAAEAPIRLKVEAIDRDASRVLARPELALEQGGHLAVRPQQGGALIPERAVFRVLLAPTDAELPEGLAARIWRGRVTIRAKAEAPALRYFDRATAVLVREFGF